jgi:hypothetical protein
MPDSVGRDAILASTKQWFGMFPDTKFAFSHVWLEGNVGVSTWDWTATDSGTGFMGRQAHGSYVVSEGVLQGTHKGPIGPFKATGKPVSLHFVDIVQFKAGKIARLQTWANGVELLTENGVIKPQQPAAAGQ